MKHVQNMRPRALTILFLVSTPLKWGLTCALSNDRTTLEHLVDKNPYTCEGPSTTWSCVRRVDHQAIANRDNTLYGFNTYDVPNGRRENQTQDDTYVAHIPNVPMYAPLPYLKIRMPEKLWQTIDVFFQAHFQTAAQHENVRGGYSNDHKFPFLKINLDHHPQIKSKIIKSFQGILEDWSQMPLEHTSTFGIRIYQNQSMLINHVDRQDTHHLSAVLHIARSGMKFGWPLEIRLHDGSAVEVYLQPGDAVLYLGSKFMHGRPLRMNGTYFANIFTHFKPRQSDSEQSQKQEL